MASAKDVFLKTLEEIRNRAFQLMLETIELLDKSDSAMSAIHIQRAIDLLPTSDRVTEHICDPTVDLH